MISSHKQLGVCGGPRGSIAVPGWPRSSELILAAATLRALFNRTLAGIPIILSKRHWRMPTPDATRLFPKPDPGKHQQQGKRNRAVTPTTRGSMNRALPPGAGPDRSRNPRGQPRPPWLVPGSLGLVCGVEDSRWEQKQRRRVVPSSATCQVTLIKASSAWTLCPAVPMYCYAALVCAIQSVCAFVATWPFGFCRSSRFGRP